MLFVSVLVASLGAADGAGDATRPVAEAIDVTAPKCLDPGELSVRIAEWLGRDKVDARVRVRVEERPLVGNFWLLRDGVTVGFRQMPRGRHPCSSWRAAMALAIAVALDDAVLEEVRAIPSFMSSKVKEPAISPLDSASPSGRYIRGSTTYAANF